MQEYLALLEAFSICRIELGAWETGVRDTFLPHTHTRTQTDRHRYIGMLTVAISELQDYRSFLLLPLQSVRYFYSWGKYVV